MQETIKFLYEIGFSPLNIVLGIGIVVLWRLGISRDAKQTADREEWHAETRKQVEKLEAHTQECNDDRIKLKAQMEILSKPCVKPDCPRRLQG